VKKTGVTDIIGWGSKVAKITQITMAATIATAQYSNISPTITVETKDNEDLDEANKIALDYITRLSNTYSEPDKKLPIVGASNNRVKLRAFVGGDYWYDAERHEYSNEAGEVYLSSSVYGQSFKKPFDKQAIAGAMAKKNNANADEIIKMWELNAEASRDFGNSIHKAMQLFETYRDLAGKLNKDSHLHNNVFLKDVVTAFYASHKQKALSEVVAIDHAGKRATTIDRLEILGDKHGRIADYKTGEITPDKLQSYFKQCEFSTEIMEVNGWKMEKPIIYGWNGGWSDYASE
jgi:hypothetical protein